MNLSDISKELSAWLPVEAHEERKIKGGGTWYYIPHQAIRDRLNEICPGEWETEYVEVNPIEGSPIYFCKLKICGVTRTGIGDKSNESSPFGTGAQRAFRKAFTDAAEQFGIGAYLDEQSDRKTKQGFIQYMQNKGNGRAAVHYHENERIENGGEPRVAKDPPSKPFGATVQPKSKPATIQPTTEQVKPSEPAIQNPNVNADRLRALGQFMGLTPSKVSTTVKAAIEAVTSPGSMSKDLSPIECDRVVDRILINYGFANGSFGSFEECELYYQSTVLRVPEAERMGDRELAQKWLKKLAEYTAKSPVRA
jgi:hypothetical protein